MIRNLFYKKPVAPSTTQLPSGLLTNLTAWWKFDEASGTRVNSANPGVLDLTPFGTTSAVTGIINGGAATGGAGGGNADRFSCSHTSALSLTQDISFSIWFKSASADATLFGDTNGGNYGYIFYISSSTLYFQCNNGSISYSAALSFTANVWNHIVITWTYSTGTLKVYRNDTLVINSSSLGTPTNSFTSVFAPGTAGNYFGGTHSFDEAAVWTGRILSAGDVTSLYNGGIGVTY